jgi:hypothetical protein
MTAANAALAAVISVPRVAVKAFYFSLAVNMCSLATFKEDSRKF